MSKKKYGVSLELFGTVLVVVEAENEEEAREQAYQHAHHPVLCHECSHEISGDLELGEVVDVWEEE